jgi:hypothetical protein
LRKSASELSAENRKLYRPDIPRTRYTGDLPMRRLFLLLLALPALTGPMQSLNAQSYYLQVPPEQCLWRAGDNPQWAGPTVDLAQWKPYAPWKLRPEEASVWIRCHTDLSALRTMPYPGIEVNLNAGYQLFLNGKQIASVGNLRTGQYPEDSPQIFALPTEDFNNQPGAGNTIALRVVYGDPTATDPAGIIAGDMQALREHRAGLVVEAIRVRVVYTLIFGVAGVMGFIVFGLYLNDRTRFEFLLLAIVCWCMATFRIAESCANIGVFFSSVTYALLVSIGQTGPVIEGWFMFRLAGKPVPWLFRILAFCVLSVPLVNAMAVFLPAAASLHLQADFHPIYAKLGPLSVLYALSPFFAFWPVLRRRNPVTSQTRVMALCCMLWGVADAAWFSGVTVATNTSFGPTFYRDWAHYLLEIRVLTTIGAVITLLVLFLRNQRRVAQERVLFAGEMQAAREIQSLLVNSTLQIAPGLQIEAVFRPAREVGGDFYRCRLLPHGAQRVLLGDVSGKGAAAAMTAAMLLGAVEGHDNDSPSALLSHLNDAFKHSGLGGFATCLCLDVSVEGIATFANAGHLPPYRNGKELACTASLPLGIVARTLYPEETLQLAPGDQLTMLSDGVLEARNAAGELYGFERTAAISTQPAEAIARAAQNFGQDDDITVLTVSFPGVPCVATT